LPARARHHTEPRRPASAVAVQARFDGLLGTERTTTLPAEAYWLAGILTVASPVLGSMTLVAVGAHLHACPFAPHH